MSVEPLPQPPAVEPAAPPRRKGQLGQLLLEQGAVTVAQIQAAIDYQKRNGCLLGEALVRLAFVSEEALAQVLSRQYGVPYVSLTEVAIDPATINVVPATLARKYGVMPVAKSGAALTIAMPDPTNVFAIDEIQFVSGYQIRPVVAPESAIRRAHERYYGAACGLQPPDAGDADAPAPAAASFTAADLDSLALPELALETLGDEQGAEVETVKADDDEIDLTALTRSSEDAPIVKLANLLLVDALKRGASDIHLEAYEKDFRVRFRVDGVLYNVMALPLKLRDALTSRLKIMARLDIAEKRLPQDGRIKIRLKIEDRKRDVDFRVSSLPTLWGEKVVLRLLDRTKLMLDMTRLGFEPSSLERFQRAIAKPYGIVLVTGPTGSGKTNTLYSAVASLNPPETNIMTAEDPVEFNLPGVNQVQIRDQIGLSFAAALRAFLRQDPNTILVGEIRDYETAEIAVKAALTGHLVLSTLHTNDAPSTVSRLVNMGIEPFLVGTAVNLIQAQRLIRRICSGCKEEATDVPARTLVEIGFQPEEVASLRLYKGRGCALCSGSGYKGRIGLYEVMEISERLRDLVLAGATSVELRKQAIAEGMLTLRMSGLEKIRAGITTVAEVLRETVL